MAKAGRAANQSLVLLDPGLLVSVPMPPWQSRSVASGASASSHAAKCGGRIGLLRRCHVGSSVAPTLSWEALDWQSPRPLTTSAILASSSSNLPMCVAAWMKEFFHA